MSEKVIKGEVISDVNSNEAIEGPETVLIKDEISRCEDVEELKEMILPQLRSQQEGWTRKIETLIKETGYSMEKFGEKCRVSRQTVNNWKKGALPKSREQFIRIGLTAGCTMEEMNQLLQRYGRYQGLYSKIREDCVCIFVLNHNYGEEAVDKFDYILKRIDSSIFQNDKADSVENVTTEKFDAKLSEVQDDDELERFIADNAAMFANSYHKFYAYVKMNIEENYVSLYAGSVNEMAIIQGWSSSLKQAVSAIRRSKWMPTRSKVISLGLHLSMDHDQIDEMLKLVHMEPLCAKNILESVIMFILDDASLQGMLDTEAEDYDPDELCNYAKSVIRSIDMPELEEFIAELPEDDNEW